MHLCLMGNGRVFSLNKREFQQVHYYSSMIDLPLSSPYFIVVIVLMSAMAILAVVDIVLALNDIETDNINHVLHDLSNKKFYFIPFFWGVLIGHLFLGSYTPWINMNAGIIAVATATLMIIIVGQIWPLKKEKPSFRISLLVAGIAYGHFLWSMNFTECLSLN